jgi:phage terminase large subunit-like protein
MTHGAPAAGEIDPRYRPPVGHLLQPAEAAIERDTPAERQAQMEALRWARIHRAREDFRAFMEYALLDADTGQPVQVQWFHEEWIDALDNYPRVCIVASRSHGKSTTIIARVVWELGRNPNLRIKIACEDQTAAVKRLSEIKRHIEKNPRVREVFPNLLPGDGDVWSKTQITVQRTIIDKDPSVEAQGVLGGATGGRCDILIGDDVVGRRNALTTPALRGAVKQAWYADWLNLAGLQCRVWVIGTLYHREDMTHEILANPEWHHVFHAITDYLSIWPDGRSSDWLREKRALIGATEYARGFANKPQDESESPVSPDWIEYVRPEALPPREELEIYTSYDPATEVGEHNDFTAEVVIGIHQPTETVFVLDAERRKITRARQSDWVQASYHKWRPSRILVESIGNDLAQWVLNDNPALAGVVERVRNLSTRGSKLHRLTAVTPFLERGHLVFLDHLDPANPEFDPERGNPIEELLDFGFAKHDDLCDSLVNALDAARYYALDRWAARGATLIARTNAGADAARVTEEHEDGDEEHERRRRRHRDYE